MGTRGTRGTREYNTCRIFTHKDNVLHELHMQADGVEAKTNYEAGLLETPVPRQLRVYKQQMLSLPLQGLLLSDVMGHNAMIHDHIRP